MAYRFAVERENYADYASGRVFYNLPGQPAFPVRLVSEIFQRCEQLRSAAGLTAPVRTYDPCCGSGYQLAVLGSLHGERIREIGASDIDEQALAVARRNLSLLTREGLDRRIADIEKMQRLYGKPSHDEARQSAEVLKNRLGDAQPIAVDVFQADALQGKTVREHFAERQVDLVISDVPYGLRSAWRLPVEMGGKEPIWLLLENLQGILAEGGLVVIAAGKQVKIAHEGYRQVEKLKMGKRQVVWMGRKGMSDE